MKRAGQAQLALELRLDPGMRFASYYAGGNGVALELVRAMTRSDGEPIALLWGPAGVGKTHLLQAACAEMAAGTALYLSVGEHLGELAQALGGLESLALVCLDDLHAAFGDSRHEAEVFHLINRMRQRQGRLLVSTQGPPGDRVGLPDLRSRLRGGPVVQLQPLPEPQRIEALRLRASCRGLALPEAVGLYLLRHYQRDLKGLMASLDRLDRASLAEQRALSVAFVRRILG